MCAARSLILYVARFSFVARYSGYRCVAHSLFLSVARLSFLLLTIVATGASPVHFRSVARFLLLATPALVCYPLSPSTLRDSLPLLDTLATGALPALFPPVAHLSFLLLITVITGVERTQTGRGKDNAGVQ